MPDRSSSSELSVIVAAGAARPFSLGFLGRLAEEDAEAAEAAGAPLAMAASSSEESACGGFGGCARFLAVTALGRFDEEGAAAGVGSLAAEEAVGGDAGLFRCILTWRMSLRTRKSSSAAARISLRKSTRLTFRRDSRSSRNSPTLSHASTSSGSCAAKPAMRVGRRAAGGTTCHSLATGRVPDRRRPASTIASRGGGRPLVGMPQPRIPTNARRQQTRQHIVNIKRVHPPPKKQHQFSEHSLQTATKTFATASPTLGH